MIFLSSVSISEGVTTLPSGVFYGCTGLQNITFPLSLKSIGSKCFEGCTGLQSLILHEGVTSIGGNAFSGCTKVKELVLPSSLNAIEDGVFSDCTGLQKLTLHEGLTSIGGSAFQRCTGIKELLLPSSLTKIGYYAFSGCTGIESMVLRSELESASSYWAPPKMETLIISEGVTSLKSNLFDYSITIKEVTLPSTLTRIGASAFRGTVETVVVKALTPPNFGSSAFSTTNPPAIFVPAAALDAYKAATGWKEYELQGY